MHIHRLALLLLLFVCVTCNINAQNEGEWQEWEELFDGINAKQGITNAEAGLLMSRYNLNVTFKRQREYYGKYKGQGQELGAYFQTNLVNNVDLRFSFLYSEYGFMSRDSLTNLDVTLGLVRVPLSLVFTFPVRFVQPQLTLGFNLGHLIKREGHIYFESENVLPDYWASTITSGLHSGLAVQKILKNKLLIRLGSTFSLDVLNPFDKLAGVQGQLALGYRW